MTGQQRQLTIVLVVVGLLAGWSRADSGDDDARQERRDQMQRSRTLLTEALDQIDSGSVDSAVAMLHEILADDVKNADAHFHLGRVFLSQGDSTAAMAILEQGVERTPLSKRLSLLLARVQIASGAPEDAAALLQDVLTLRPRDGETLYLRGLAHLAAGDSASALTAWRDALESTDGGRSR